MSENEAKQWLKHTRAYQHKCDNCEYIDIKGACNEECKDFYDMAIKALEDVQKYRAIGTVEQLEWCKDASHWKELFKEKLEKYEAIGTVEELKELKAENAYLQNEMQSIGANMDLFEKEIRAEVIDEFAETLKEKYEEHNFDLCLRQNDYYSYSNSCMLFESYIDEIAEQLKAGEIE